MNYIKVPVARGAVVAALAVSFGTIFGVSGVAAADAEYDNYIDIAGAGSNVTGDKANFQKYTHETKGGMGGLSGFHYGQDLDKDTTITADGHALAGNDDFKLELKLIRNNVGYIAAGYSQFRTWFDGNGGALPAVGLTVNLYDNNLYLDRKDLWFEAAFTPPDKVQLKLRYDYLTRDGDKDSTSWGDTTAGALGSRNIVPTFLRINEQRHVISASASLDSEATSWEVAGRYETSKFDNRREIHRSPGSATADRYVTQSDVTSSDLFMMRGSVETKIGETLSMSTGMAHYDIDTNIEGSRIYGSNGYDPVFNATYARRQYHDEGFNNLDGTAHMSQTLANLNLMYTPTEHLTIVPSLLAEKTSWSANDAYDEVAVGAAPALLTAVDPIEGDSNKSLRSATELIEARYTGFKNVALNTSLELNQGYGALDEEMVEAETGEPSLFRNTDYRRDGQKFAATASWYAKPGLSLTGQYYWKGKQNSFNNTNDSVNPAPPSGDRYPGYISHQDYATNDFNVRLNWAPTAAIHTVTRYDYQETKIRTQVIGLAFITSGDVKSNIVSETITWNPLDRLFVQASGNFVNDQTTTPVDSITGNVSKAVLELNNDYVSGDLMVGYALDDKTDVTASYSYYRADNFSDNSSYSVPYGAGDKYQTFSVSWFRRVSPRLNYLVKYMYGDNADELSASNANFRASTVYAKVQYRF